MTWPGVVSAAGTREILEGIQAQRQVNGAEPMDGFAMIRQLVAGALQGTFSSQPREPLLLTVQHNSLKDICWDLELNGPVVLLLTGVVHAYIAICLMHFKLKSGWYVGWLMNQNDIKAMVGMLPREAGDAADVGKETVVRFRDVQWEEKGQVFGTVVLRKGTDGRGDGSQNDGWAKPVVGRKYVTA